MAARDGKSVEEMVGEIHEILLGNGEPQKGLVVRFDRVEQGFGMAKWFVGVVIVALIGLFIGQIRLINTADEVRQEVVDEPR